MISLLKIGSRLLVIATLTSAAFCANYSVGQQVPSAGMMRYPDVSESKIVFSYADDLWVVDREGGAATPLASPAGSERTPRFSPDGKEIAFVGNYEGGDDIYKISVEGGVAKRMTYHPGTESLCDWLPDGDGVLFSSNGHAGLGRQPQLFKLVEKRVLPERLGVPYGTNGALSKDGKWLAYTPHSRDTRTWKRYRGGMASDVWLFNLKTKKSNQLTKFEGTDSFPMWHGNTVFYLSDAGDEHRLNIWSCNYRTMKREQITKFKDYDCKWPSIGPGTDGQGEIVLSCGPDLYLVDLEDGSTSKVKVSIPGDRPKLRKQKVDASEFVEYLDISSTGKRVVASARGDIWTAPVKNGVPRNLTKTDGEFERDPYWSPDGRWIAYLSDKTGEYELFVTQSDGRGETKQLTKDGDCFKTMSGWSPDSKHIAFSDKRGGVFIHTIESGETKKIDTDPMADQLTLSWSHDSNWVVYSKASDERAPVSSVWVYNVSEGKATQLTSGYFNDTSPVFDREGKFIYFSSSRAFNRPKYEDLGTTFIYSGTEVLMAMPLSADFEHPMLPKIDEEEWEEEEEEGDEEGEGEGDDDSNSKKKSSDKPKGKDAKKKDSDKKDADKKDAEEDSNGDESKSDKEDSDDEDEEDKDDAEEEEVEPLEIDFEGIERRSFQLPIDQGSFGGLAVNAENQLVFARVMPRGTEGDASLNVFDLSADEEDRESETVVDGVGNFSISADGKKLVVFKGDSLFVVDAAAGQKLEKPVSTDGMNVMVDPQAEWKQIFKDAWRMQRDFFYDPKMHGVDWDKVGKRYEKMLDDCVSRRDVGFVIGEMIAELNVGHAYYRSGDVERGPRANVGLLGCRFERDGRRYKIAELYQGAVWDTDARNPLVSAGVKQGQYLMEIDGIELTTKQNPFELLQGKAGKAVSLAFSDDKSLTDEDKRVVIKALPSDNNLRFRAWIESNRAYVDKKTDGKVGYIYVVNTGVPGQNDLVRQYFAQLNKEALIIDDRWNGGGQIPTRFIELLNRPVTNYWARRDGRDWTWPPDSHQGPKCMLINGMAGSGGDMFPALFRQAELGKLIGMRTWGGLVGITGGPSLLDGASVTAPSFAYYEKDGTWGIEGHGVDPDVKVVDDPAKMADGGDPQLDAGIEQMLKELKSNAYKAPKRPAYPDRSKFGLEDSDK